MSSILWTVFNIKLFPFFEQAKMIAEVWKKMGAPGAPFDVVKVKVERKSKHSVTMLKKYFSPLSLLVRQKYLHRNFYDE